METDSAYRTGRLDTILEGSDVRLVRVSKATAAYLSAATVPPGQRSADGYPLDGTVRAASNVLRLSLDDDGFGMYQIVERKTREVVGDIGFHMPPDAAGRVEIGYGLAPMARGRGLMTEAARLLMEAAFASGRVVTICAHVESGNHASRRLLERLGMEVAGADGGGTLMETSRPL